MNDRQILAILTLLSLCLWCCASLSAQESTERPMAPSNLRCEYLADPVGIDVVYPRLSWVPEHGGRGQKQSAYQILVSASPEVNSGDQWDSGKVDSEEFAHVAYAGKGLESRRTYYWKVRYWDKGGTPSPYSRIARFEMGFFSPDAWVAKWIGGANQLRKEFSLPGVPVRARAYVCGLGYYELRVNGTRVGRSVLDPAWTPYSKRVLYVTHDITRLLQRGGNAIAVSLGQGWYGSRVLRIQVEIESEGGTRTQVVSDSSWKCRQGPILSDSVYDGETYDARMETPGWDQAAYDESGWQAAKAVDAPKGIMSAQMMPPIQVVDTIIPLKVTNPHPGVYLYDMGQNLSGWARLRVRGPRGTQVKMRFAELLHDNGRINVENLRNARATDVYILKGEGDEIYEPHFTYHGFRYVEVTGFPGTPKIDSLRGRVVHSAVTPHGGFSSSNSTLNQIQRIILWGQKTNLHSIPTDCSQRDERMGWMGDAQVTAEEAMLNYDMAAFYLNFLRDIRDEQGDDGTVTDTVPHKGGRRPADPAWGAALPLICWYMYQHYGDKQILAESYEAVKRWVDYLKSRAKDGVLEYSYYGDWVAIEKTPGEVVSTFYFAYCAEVLGRMAEVLGKLNDAQTYLRIAADSRSAFHKTFYNERTGSYSTGTQTANALALFLDAVPKEKRSSVRSRLADDIVYGHNTHLTTGFIGVKYLMELLSNFDRHDLAFDLAIQTSFPSWGYMIENGATTLWELWQNKTGPAMNSHNHPMFGSVGAWFYRALAGINSLPKAPGYRQIRIAPQPAGDLRWVSASTETMRGTVASAWSRLENGFRLDVVIPFGSDAEIELPKWNLRDVVIKEGDRVVWKEKAFQPGAPALTGAREEARTIVFRAGSGRYTFELTGN